MVNSRNKGAAFERKIVNLLKEFSEEHNADIHITRNFEQMYKKGECDINFLNYAIECKCYAEGKGYKSGWWEQVCISAGESRIPVLVYKYNRSPIEVAMPFWSILKDEPKDNNKIFTCKWDDFIDIIKKNKIFNAYVNRDE